MSIFNLKAQFEFSTGKEVSLEITAPYETVDVHCIPNPICNMSINWDLIEIDPNLPSGWNYTICDQICYPFFPNHGTPVDFTADQFTNGEFYKLKLGVTTNGIEGSGFVKYVIYNFNNPTYRDTVIFHLNYQSNGLTETSFKVNEVSYLLLNNSISLSSNSGNKHSVELVSTNGTSILKTEFEFNTLIDEPILAGVYYLIIDQTTTHKIVFFN